jgi:beta-glucosidase
MVTSSNLDERTLNELYLPAFEIAVKEAQPWTVMSSYNLVNGIYASEHRHLLEDILREKWGLVGFVVSDWGGINNRVAGLEAGTDLEMPGSGDYNRKKIIEAVENGRLSAAKLEQSVIRVLAIILMVKDRHRENVSFDREQNHALARRVGGESVVLLKNEEGILPLSLEKLDKVSLIGAFAKSPRYQGAGSSQVNPTKVSNAYEELMKIAGDADKFAYAEGYTNEGDVTEALLEEARQVAASSQVAVIFAGLPDSFESEGFDRASLEMPAGHNRLIEAVSVVQPNVIVVLMNGSAVTMPWADRAKAILEGWLGGQAGGGAIADVLSGRANPSGKLAETFPKCLEDTPTFPNFPGRDGQAYYGEGLFIGYRYYDKKNIEPLFPFGYGLSYTKFAYTGIKVTPSSIKDTEEVTVEVTVKNAGMLGGKEIVQLYVHERTPAVVRPERELRAFEKVALAPGEELSVSFKLSKRDFSFYDTALNDWNVSSGKFEILVGGSSRDLPLKETVEVEKTYSDFPKLRRTSVLKEFRDHPKGKAYYPQLLEVAGLDTSPKQSEGLSSEQAAAKEKAEMAMMAFLNDMPANKLPAFSEGKFTLMELDDILRKVD